MSIFNIVPTNTNYNYFLLIKNINSLKSRYPFLEIFSSGKSVLGKNIPVIKIGTGSKEVFYSGAIHR
jgi:zinc carboxypeptidase family protein